MSIKEWKSKVFQHVQYEHLLAGVTGGAFATLVLHPLDLIKIRFAVNDGTIKEIPQYKGLGNAVVTIVKEEGIAGLYRGVTPNVWGAGTSWGLYFLFYNAMKMRMEESLTELGPGHHMLAAAEAGIMTLALTNPLWVIKTRLCLQYKTMPELPSHKQYSGMIDAFRKVYKHEGPLGLYKGFIPGMFGVSHGALQFMSYEELKKYYNRRINRPTTAKLTAPEYIFFAALSKLFAASVTYPYQVVRARLQDQHRDYKGILDVVVKTWRYESLPGFYKGATPYLCHVMPSICIIFLTYENVSHLLFKLHKTRKDPEKDVLPVKEETVRVAN